MSRISSKSQHGEQVLLSALHMKLATTAKLPKKTSVKVNDQDNPA
jgi:hypothetical protein